MRLSVTLYPKRTEFCDFGTAKSLRAEKFGLHRVMMMRRRSGGRRFAKIFRGSRAACGRVPGILRRALLRGHHMNPESPAAQVRLAVSADTPQIARLVEHYWRFEQIEGFDTHDVQKLLDTLVSRPPLGAVWLATIGGEPAGYAIVTFMFSLEHRGMMAEIDEFFVLPEARAHGVGASLLAASETHLRAHNFVRLQLQIDRDNHLARSFYQRHGFEDRAAYQLLDKPLTAAL
jgi:GNAT superfamily N-acetyltransferase